MCQWCLWFHLHFDGNKKTPLFAYTSLFGWGAKKSFNRQPVCFSCQSVCWFHLIFVSVRNKQSSLLWHPKISLLFAPITQIKKWSIQRLILMPGLFTSFIRTAKKTNRRCGEQKSWKTNRTKEMNRFTWWFVDLKWERESKNFLLKTFLIWKIRNSWWACTVAVLSHVCVRACLYVYTIFLIFVSLSKESSKQTTTM